jgi:hypothetical protein
MTAPSPGCFATIPVYADSTGKQVIPGNAVSVGDFDPIADMRLANVSLTNVNDNSMRNSSNSLSGMLLFMSSQIPSLLVGMPLLLKRLNSSAP